MKHIEPVSMETAHQLVDFGGGAMSKALAEDQLQGAVALHNVLAKEGFAYLADEVGMGKTYIALGVVALIRFFHRVFVFFTSHLERIFRGSGSRSFRISLPRTGNGSTRRLKATRRPLAWRSFLA